MERLEAARRLLDHAQRHGIGRYPHILLGEAVATAVAALQEPGTPCAACGYGGKHLEAPPCTTCPAYPKLENTLKLLESNGDRFRALTDEQMVAECIEREELLNRIRSLIGQITPLEESRDMFYHDSGMNAGITRAMLEVRDMPAADVEPVVHGRWVLIETGYSAKIYECSECKDDDYWKHHFAGGFEHYCPNCGARMDG